jgi:hypothetical protein
VPPNTGKSQGGLNTSLGKFRRVVETLRYFLTDLSVSLSPARSLPRPSLVLNL